MQKRLITALLFTLFFTVAAISQSVVERPIVWQVPEMPSIKQQDHSVNLPGDTLNFTCFHPIGYQVGQQWPTVVFANGGIENLPQWRVYQDWAKLMAAHGFIAILHHSKPSNRDKRLGQILDYCHENGAKIGVDGQRLGVWACSGNVTAAYPQIMDEQHSYLRAAALYYGMPNSIQNIRQDLPLQIVRAGLDSYSLNRKIDEFLQRALKVDLPLDFVNYLEGYHAFDILNDTPRSRQIMQHTVDFFKLHLSSATESSGEVLTGTTFYEMVIRGEWERAEAQMKSTLAADEAAGRPFRGYFRVADENNLNWIGYHLMREGLNKEAVFVMQLNQSLFPDSPNTYDSLADAYEANKQPQKALAWAKKTIEFMKGNKEVSERQRTLLLESANDKIKRLEK
ncbi:MAG: hypothetical protein KTR30_05205 [Saprospiraceae bacterium]|nr:hypothetical protein [Saprospiraceae bacterium]